MPEGSGIELIPFSFFNVRQDILDKFLFTFVIAFRAGMVWATKSVYLQESIVWIISDKYLDLKINRKTNRNTCLKHKSIGLFCSELRNDDKEKTYIWPYHKDPTQSCNALRGTDATFFKPYLKKDHLIYAFEPQICRLFEEVNRLSISI